MAKTSKNDRKPAEIVKCPYCDHTGSARGLFSHVRLAHQGKNVNTRKEWLKNPYSVEKKANPQFTKEKLQQERADLLGAKKKRKTSYTEEIGTALLIAGINALIRTINQKRPQGIGAIPQLPENP